MTTDLGRRIRQLTETLPISVAEVWRQSERRRRRPRASTLSVPLAVLAVLAGVLFVATRPPGSPQRVRVVQGPARTGCTGAYTTPPDGAGPPVVRSSAIVFAPTASHLAGDGTVTVGLNTTEDEVVLSIQRKLAAPHGVNFQMEAYEGDRALSGFNAVAFKTMRAGDPVQVEMAIRNTDPTVGGLGSDGVMELASIAYRLVDLRTHQSAQSGAPTLLRATAASLTQVATSTHSDVSVTEATWGSGWDAVNVGLGDEAVRQPAFHGGAPLVGVTHKGSAFVVVDAVHRRGLAVGITALHAQAATPSPSRRPRRLQVPARPWPLPISARESV
jgi:hypothetical protein